jgi:hypothetical protein
MMTWRDWLVTALPVATLAALVVTILFSQRRNARWEGKR